MGIKEEVVQIRSVKTPPSKIEKIVAALPPEDRDELLEVLSDPEIDSKSIATVLQHRGLDITERSIQRNRDKYLGN